MTGSLLLNRQHSSTAGYSNTSKMARPKLRRCSSADDHSNEVTPDDSHHKKNLFNKRDPTASEDDSGIEDFGQIVNDDAQTPPQCFGACEDEYDEENVTPTMNESFEYPEQTMPERIYNDILLAAQVPDEEKKDFCTDTRQVFHAEFARRIACLIGINYPGVYYRLLTEDDFGSDPIHWPGFVCIHRDNAKAQFKCPNPLCRRLWTSMRARISFKISLPQQYGFVVLKIYGQQCQQCGTPSEALWYIEEVCRVMENLSKAMFVKFFPALITDDDSQGVEVMQNVGKASRSPRHDPNQRKGNMQARHNKDLCEACQHGCCFA